MATTQNTYTGNNSTTEYSFTFPYLEESDVKVSLDGVDQTTTAYSFANATTISFNTAPGTGVAIRIYRVTNTDSAQATFFAGSAIRAQDLNDNNNQVLYSTQETVNRRLDNTGGTLTGDLVMDNADIVFEGATADAFETTLTVVDPTADRTITLPNVTGTVVTTGDTGTVATAMIAADAVNGTKIADDSIDSEHYVDASIDTQHIADAQITTAKIAADAVTNAKIADDSIDSEHYVDGSIDTAHIADLQVTTAKIAADAVTNAKIADNSIDSEHYVDGSIDTAHIADSQVTTAKIADANVTTAKITDANVTTAKLADSSVTTAKIADANVTAAKLADASVTNAKLADAELQELATMGGLTAAALADLTQAEVQILDGATVTTAELNLIDGLTANATDLNQLDTNTLTNSPTWTSTSQYPSAASIDSRITARIDPLGGFEAIADEDSFPATAPPEGTVVSIANANGLAVNASGVGAGTRAGGSNAVVINGFPSGFNSTSLDDGIGLLVVATSTAHTYDFHRVVAKNEDVRQLSSDINDFKARYRVGSSNPTTDLDSGDLFFNTGSGKMLVYDGTSSAWEEVQSIGNFSINTLSSSGGTGGGSATFNGTAYRFTLSDPPTFAQQLIVSVNGVVQKPNSGTAQPSEGFAIDGADIIFSDPPATSSPFFIITMGSTVNIGTPSDNTVGPTQLIDTAVTAGSYTLSSITVDAQGRITAASSGTAADPDIITEGNTSVEVVDTGSDGTITFTTEGSPRATIDSPGRLLVGTSTARSNIYMGGASDIPKFQFEHSGNNYSGQVSLIQYTSGGTAPTYTLGISKSNTPGTNAVVASGDTLGTINFVGNDGTNFRTAAQIQAGVDGTPGANDMPGRLVFSTTTDGASSPTERMRIDSSGRVGIGTTSPGDYSGAATKLSIAATGNSGLNIVSGTSSTGIIRFADGTVGDAAYRGRVEYMHDVDALMFGTAANERARIDSSGRLGIGTTSPGTRLHLSGTQGDNSTLYITSTDLAANNGGIISIGGAYDGSGNTTAFTQIKALKDNATSGEYGGSLAFFNRAGTGGLTEKVRIDSSGNLKFNSGYGSVATAYGCRAWVNFNGTGTVSIRASGNVSSITDNGTGNYTVNFSTSMPDANYIMTATGTDESAGPLMQCQHGTRTTSACPALAINRSGSVADTADYQAAFFR